MPRLPLLLLCSVAAACHGAGTDPQPPPTDGNGTTTDGTSSGNRPPQILEASANTSLLLTSQILSIQVVATDPDGIANLIGGVVKSPAGATYAALATSADEGAYQVDLSWDRINQTEPIVIPPGKQVTRDFHIEVFDEAGAAAAAMVSVALASSSSAFAVCNGVNVDPLSPQHCGSCSFSCLDDFGSTYGGALCVTDGGVFCTKTKRILLTTADGATTCSEACQNAAGPKVFSVNVSKCPVLNSPAACKPDNCNTASFATLPPICAGSTSLQCVCDGYWESPGF